MVFKKKLVTTFIFCFLITGYFPFEAYSQETKGSYSITIENKINYGYILHQPKKGVTKKPLIVFLHGSGEKGFDLEKVKVHGPLKYLQTNELDAYVLAPQCPENTYWESESLYQLIQKIIKENPIDINRVYLTGLSMGAWGAWNLAFAHPEIFAALVPICGFVYRVPMIENCKIANISTRIYHGLLDDIVDVEYSITIFKKLKSCSKDIQLTIFDDANHDSWSRVYADVNLYKWMLSQIKNQ